MFSGVLLDELMLFHNQKRKESNAAGTFGNPNFGDLTGSGTRVTTGQRQEQETQSQL